MITNFEEITQELTADEMVLCRQIVLGLRTKTKDNPIKSDEIVNKMNQANPKNKLTGARLRKIINYIRSNGILPVIATSNGYYTSNDKSEIQKQILSLYQRARSIETCADGLKKFIETN